MNIDLISLFALLFFVSGITGALVVFVILYQRKVLKKQREKEAVQVELKKTELAAAYSLLEGQEQERQRIAEDLHDHVGAMMTTISTYSQLIDLDNPSPMLPEVVNKLKETTQLAAKEVRRVSHELDLSTFNIAQFEQSIASRADIFKRTKDIEVHYEIAIDKVSSMALLRDVYLLLQEMLTNTAKHAEASEVRIKAEVIGDETLHVTYQDNGKGMDMQAKSDGIGLKNMRSRVDKHDGKLEIKSALGEGVKFTLRFAL